MPHLPAKVARSWLVWLELLANDGKVGLMRGQSEHDEVRIGTAKNMLRIRVVIWLRSLLANVIHDFMLAFSRDVGIGEDNFDVSPSGIVVHALMNVVLEASGESGHKRSPGSDAIGVKMRFLRLKKRV